MALVLKKSVVPLRRLLWINNNNQSRDYHISYDDLKALFEEWVIEYDTVYKTAEEKQRRFSIFRDRFWWVKKHNSSGYHDRVGINNLADVTSEELRKRGRRRVLRKANGFAWSFWPEKD
ncbi:putative actinidain [Helianthus annuus]|uniref:Actinidain n=1 Tax=Helianthus annuus TaxID=4232 RepID=A0A251VL09_HELAN|nr:actinidain [Helianthus annuus]KAF5821032.1 putative actinidain [Helianthus annuus]KAJ0955946.1 putative actinidain [Helianthus annuus]